MNVVLRGGPADGAEMAIFGGRPSYLMMMRNPVPDSMPWIVVGSDFDDRWPDSHRYELRSWLDDERSGHATYVHVPTVTCPRCGMTSAHPRDVEQGYCGNCHDWTR